MAVSTDLELIRAAADHAIAYATTIDDRPPTPSAEALAALTEFDEPLPEGPRDPSSTIDLLQRVGGPATMGTTGQSYFGFVNGATFPVALGASFLVDAWDQNAALPVMSPTSAAVYDVARRWTLDVLRLPPDSDVAFVTGATVANASCLAAARDALLVEHGWDVQRDGLFGAPEIQVVIGENAHSTLRKSLGLIGLGRERVTVVPSDDQGCLRADLLPTDLGSGTARPSVRSGGRGEHRRVRPVRRHRRLGHRRARAGCTSTGRSDSGHSPTRRGATSSPGSIGRTRGRPTGTSG